MDTRTVTGGIGMWDVGVYVHETARERPIGDPAFTLNGADVENLDRETGLMRVRLRDGSVDTEHDAAALFMLMLSLARVDFGQYSTTITGSLDEVRAYSDATRIFRERCTLDDCSESPAHDVINYLPPPLGLGKFRYVTLSLRPARKDAS